LHDAAVTNSVDMVIGNMRKSFLGDIIVQTSSFPTEIVNRTIAHDELMSKYYLSFFGYNILPVNMCGKLYRTSLVKEAFKPWGYKFGEDLVFNMRLFPSLNSVFCIPNTVYCYRQFSGCTSHFMPYWIDTAKRLYVEKKAEMEKHDYVRQADYYVKVEMINCLLTYIDQYIFFRPRMRDANIAALKLELQDGLYSELKDVRFRDAAVPTAIGQKDAAALYEYVEQRNKRAPLKTKAVRAIRRAVVALSSCAGILSSMQSLNNNI